MVYTIDIQGMKHDLPLCPINENLYIGAFVIFGQVELTMHCAAELLKKLPEVDYFLENFGDGFGLTLDELT